MADEGKKEFGLVGESLDKTIEFIKKSLEEGNFAEFKKEFTDKLGDILKKIEITENGKLKVDSENEVDNLTDSYNQLLDALDTATNPDALIKTGVKARSESIKPLKDMIGALLNEEAVHQALMTKKVDLGTFTKVMDKKVKDSENKTKELEKELEVYERLEEIITNSEASIDYKETNESVDNYKKVSEILTRIEKYSKDLKDLKGSSSDQVSQKVAQFKAIATAQEEYTKLVEKMKDSKEIEGLPKVKDLQSIDITNLSNVKKILKDISPKKLEEVRKTNNQTYATSITDLITSEDKDEINQKVQKEFYQLAGNEDLDFDKIKIILDKVKNKKAVVEDKIEYEEDKRQQMKEAIELYKADIQKQKELKSQLETSSTGKTGFNAETREKVEKEETQNLLSKTREEKIKEFEASVKSEVALMPRKEKFSILKAITNDGSKMGWFKRFIMFINTNREWKKYESGYINQRVKEKTDVVDQEIAERVSKREEKIVDEYATSGQLENIGNQVVSANINNRTNREDVVKRFSDAIKKQYSKEDLDALNSRMVRDGKTKNENEAANAIMAYYQGLKEGKVLTVEELTKPKDDELDR